MTREQFRQIPLAEIHESPHNTRRHFRDDTMAELVDSIRKVGVITPALVRPRPDGGFELAAGHRRFRASKEAGQSTLPCLIREMDDQAFLEVLTIENLQREDVHPLDEAKGYEALMAAPYAMPVETIAARVGKSVKYVYDRVKLLALCPDGQELFWAGKIMAGHAILLARLSLADQQRCIEAQDGLLRVEGMLYGDEDDEPRAGQTARSVRELDDWIKRHVRFDHAQPDAMLYPETAAALETARKGRRKIVEITREYLTHEDVRRASSQRVFGDRSWKRADGRDGSTVCEFVVLGVIASGEDRGETFDVCMRKDKCLVHWGAEIRAREKRQKAMAKGGAVADKAKDQYKKEEERRQKEEQREEAERAQWMKAVPAILDALAVAIRKAPLKPSGHVAGYLMSEIRCRDSEKDARVPIGSTPDDLLRHLAYRALASTVNNAYWGRRDFPKHAKALGIDLAKLLAAAEKPTPVLAAKADVKGKAPKGHKVRKVRKAA